MFNWNVRSRLAISPNCSLTQSFTRLVNAWWCIVDYDLTMFRLVTFTSCNSFYYIREEKWQKYCWLLKVTSATRNVFHLPLNNPLSLAHSTQNQNAHSHPNIFLGTVGDRIISATKFTKCYTIIAHPVIEEEGQTMARDFPSLPQSGRSQQRALERPSNYGGTNSLGLTPNQNRCVHNSVSSSDAHFSHPILPMTPRHRWQPCCLRAGHVDNVKTSGVADLLLKSLSLLDLSCQA